MPPRKKAKNAAARAGMAAPVLAEFQQTQQGAIHNSPMFKVMHPRELLILARTSEDYREFLMSRASVRIWESARQQVTPALPDCPPFLSEPEYANLVFFSHCHNCTRPNVKNVIWEFLVRYCQKCKEDMLQGHSETHFAIEVKGTGIKDLFNVIHISLSRGAFPQPVYHSPEVEEFKAEYHSGTRNDADKSLLVKQKVEEVKLINQFADAMREWERICKQQRLYELQATKETRLQSVIQRLRLAGWGQEFDTMTDTELDDLKHLKPVSQARPLTDRGWKSIQEEVSTFMEKIRAVHLERDRAQSCSSIGSCSSSMCSQNGTRVYWAAEDRAQTVKLPSLLALAPVFRKLVEVASEVKVTKETFEHHWDDIARLRERWYQEREIELAGMVSKAIASVPDGVSPLSLAVATFDCKICNRKGMRWHTILAHGCARSPTPCESDNTADDKYRGLLLKACKDAAAPGIWTNVFVFNPLHGRARAVMSACMKDPDTATYAEMENCGVRLRCKTCTSGRLVCDAYDWKAATQHVCLVPNDHFAFERLDASHTRKVLSHESAWQLHCLRLHLRSPQGLIGCTHCPASLKMAQIVTHCKNAHQITSFRLMVDCYVHLDNHYSFAPIRIYAPGQEMDAVISDDLLGGRAFVSHSFFAGSQ
ncbi:hypothetical protein L226DRAFT_568370 [Lentinus tigrinus ALCF2SS1-7]|uniref:uncharacterized protein n=1 Tax=Lentinus tigrinus ALCF2SS1-7 TaxID=1328758 RepID=UPI0011663850|nr:hypothetical protein L226DRAFT_568370 [Lentinus tigrinus ALCF2SS1-7]